MIIITSLLTTFQTIEEAECAPDPHVRAQLLEQAIRTLSAPGNPHTAEVQHAIGYAWYLHPQESEMRDDGVTRHLRNALQLDPDHKFARLYLGHHYFDRRQFAEALEILSTFHAREFSSFDQSWRDAKVSELILCCTLRLGDRQNVPQAVYRFCEALTYSDAGMNPNPDELIDTLMDAGAGV